MKCAISRAIGVSVVSIPEAKLAIRPTTDRSPVRITTPRAVPKMDRQSFDQCKIMSKRNTEPSTANVLKKAKFFVSNGFSCVVSLERD